MKTVKFLAALVVVASALLWPGSHSLAQGKKDFRIYMVLWRGCEEACEGFRAYIAKSGIDDQYAYVVNLSTARKLNMFPSVGILQIAETVE